MNYSNYAFQNCNQGNNRNNHSIEIDFFSSRLTEAEDRYRNRESRTEDLELISTLQQTIAAYQEQLKKIHVDFLRKFISEKS